MLPETLDIRIIEENGYYSVFHDKKIYPLFLDSGQETCIRGSWETDDETGERFLLLYINPKLAPRRFWEPMIAHEIGEFKHGSFSEGNHKIGDEYEASYCRQYLSCDELKEYIKFVQNFFENSNPKLHALMRCLSEV